MKKKSIIYLLLLAAIFSSCEKDDGAVPKEIGIERVPAPKIIKNGGSPAIDMTNLAGFNGKITLSLLFPGDIPPASLDLVVRKNGNSTNVKTLLSGISSFPIEITVTAAQIAAAFGVPVALGDSYDFSADIHTQSGKKYSAFPPVGGTGYGPGVSGIPGSSLYINYSAICAYRPDLFGALGTSSAFQVLTDEWGDDPVNGWGPPAGWKPTVQVTVVDATHLSFKSSVNGTSVIVLTINPLDNTISFTDQPYGNLGVGPLQVDPGWTYGAGTMENTGVSTVAPCDLKINLSVGYRVSLGLFGNGGAGYKLVLKKI